MLPELPFVLSYTLLADYKNCPKKVWHLRIKKDVKDKPKTDQQTGGISAHQALEKRLKIREPLAPEYQQFEGFCNYIQNHNSIKHMEVKLGVRRDGSACDFFAGDVALRGVVDLACSNSPHCIIFDYKTGKPFEDPFELRLGALLLKARYPDLISFSGCFYWLRIPKVGTFHRLNPDIAWAEVVHLAEAMAGRLQRQDWPPNDNVLCSWCPVPKGHGAPLDPVCVHRKDPP